MSVSVNDRGDGPRLFQTESERVYVMLEMGMKNLVWSEIE